MEYLVTDKAYKKHLFEHMQDLIATEHKSVIVRYLNLGKQIVRILCYTPEILAYIEQQLTYTLQKDVAHYDATVIAWQETDMRHFLGKINERFDLRKNLQLRLDIILCRQFYIRLRENAHISSTLVEVDEKAGRLRAYDENNKTYYVAWKSINIADIMQDGHLFVQQLYHICNTKSRHLVHGAVAGIDNNGVLFCARGGCGKSTLTVKALLDGFDYVSDDYLLLDKTANKLTASPIYSIITLSPKMYDAMRNEFKGEFVANNARGDKYVFNISTYHRQFKTDYPIKMLMFPHIMAVDKPSIVQVSKGKAITQLIHSTIIQTGDIYNTTTVRKLSDFLKNYPCYQINLCPDIEENTRYLRNFLMSHKGE